MEPHDVPALQDVDAGVEELDSLVLDARWPDDQVGDAGSGPTDGTSDVDEVADDASPDDVAVQDGNAGEGSDAGDAAVVADSGADAGVTDAESPDVAASGCGAGVSPGALGPSGSFEQCMGLPTIGKSLSKLTPVPLQCPEAPVVMGTIGSSYDFSGYFYELDTWTWETYGHGGIVTTMGAENGVVWFAGIGDIDGTFLYEDGPKTVVGAVSATDGPLWVKQSEQTGYFGSHDLIPTSTGAYLLGSADTENDTVAAFWRVPSDPALPIDTVTIAGSKDWLGPGYSPGDGKLVATTGKAYGDACEVAQAIELDASGQVLHSLVAGGVGYFTYVKVDTEIVPLGSCGYGLVTSGLAVEGDPHYKTVVLRLNEKLEVIGLWRWNISASYADVETVEGDLLLLSVTPVPIPGSYNSNAIYHIVRIDGDTGELEWQTDVDIPEHGAHELVVLPDNRIVLVGGIKGDWPDPQGFNAYPLLTVLSPDGCALAHVLYKDQLTTTGTPVKSFSNVVALSNTLLADGDAAWVHFLDLPPTP